MSWLARAFERFSRVFIFIPLLLPVLLPEVSFSASLVPEGLTYKPLEVEDLSVPVALIKHFGELFKKEGFTPFDEQNLGNIPFYWVDQIYLSYDLERSIVLKVNIELEDKKFEDRLYVQGTNFVFHSRTKNKVPYVLIFTGFKDEDRINNYLDKVRLETDHYVVDRSDPSEALAKLASFVFPAAEAAVTCTTNTHVLSATNQKNISELGAAAFNAVFNQLKGCLIAELRGARTALMAPVETVKAAERMAVKAGGVAVSAGKAIYHGEEAILRAEATAAKSGYHFVSGFFQDSYQKGVGLAMNHAARKIASKTSQASQAVTTTAASASSALSQSVTHAIDSVSQFPGRLKDLFSGIWNSVQKAWGLTLDTLIHHPAVLYNLLCNFIGTLVVGAGLPIIVGFLTGGAAFGPVLAKIAVTVGTWAKSLSALHPILETLISMGESSAALMIKLTSAVGKVNDLVFEQISSIAKMGLKKLMARAVSCAI